MATGVIAPIKKGVGDSKTLYGSLLAEGYHRAPGASLILSPKKEKDGQYRTGLDENAEYIKDLPESEQEIERQRVKTWREICEKYYRVSLAPNASFYKDMFLNKTDQEYCPIYRLKPKEEMIFDLEDPEQLVIFAYLRVHDEYIAPSFDAYQLGQVIDPAKVAYYIKDDEVEASRLFKKNSEMNKAIASLESASDFRLRTTAKAMGLGVTSQTSPTTVYNLLNGIIKQGVMEEGYYKGRKTIELFNNFMAMKDENLKMYDIVKKAIEYNIFREVNRQLYKGTVLIGENVEKAVQYLLSVEGQDVYLMLQSEIAQKESMGSGEYKKTRGMKAPKATKVGE